MLSSTAMTTQIRRLHGAGLDFAPAADLARETRGIWMDVLGDLQDGEVEDAIRVHLSGPDGHRWPSPAVIRGHVVAARRDRAPVAPTACAACTDGARRIVQLWRRQGRLVEESAIVACPCLAGEVWARSLAEQRPGRRPVRVVTLRDLEQQLLHTPGVPVESGEDGWLAWWVAPSRYATPSWTARIQAELNAQVGKPGPATEMAIAAALARLGRPREMPRGRVRLEPTEAPEETIRRVDRDWYESEGERWAS